MELTPEQYLHGFVVLSREDLPEIDGEAYVLRHEKSRARLLYLKNDDTNKSFSIAFRTPPADDSGVFHILEHSVLCGSQRFPVKEPFVNLLKSSMQTFLNAMTFPDKTMYPVASTNEQDLMNLTDVYLDAVLHPNIYRKPEIFQQEGWHYELVGGTSPDDAQLAYNGVVYNEMKGALSDPESVLLDELQAALFPDTAYRFESGGTPRAIPRLTYERFLEEHARHYRLDNSYITLYGNLDVEAMLGFLDERYLSPVADEQAHILSKLDTPTPRTLQLQAPVKKLNVQRNMVTAPENACMAAAFVIGHARERTRIVAVDILLDAIAGSNEAPLKRALLDAGLADDASAYLADGLLQPFAVVGLRGLNEGARERFLPLADSTLESLASGSLDHSLLEASLSRAEFVMRERDFGMSDGVALSITSLSGWLYDDDLATSYVRYEEDFAFLRSALDEGYFEELIREVFLENPHMAHVEIVPTEHEEPGKGEDERLAQALAAMDDENIARIAHDEAELRRLQEKPDDPEDVAALPLLGIADLGDAPAEPAYELVEQGAVPCLVHHIPTRNIAYVYRYFDLSRLRFEDLPYAKLLTKLLGKLPTTRHSASELDTLINGRLGALSFFGEVYGDEQDSTLLSPKFVVGASALSENLDELTDLVSEILLATDFSDTAKIKDVLQQLRLGMEQGFSSAGHSYAMARVASYVLPSGVLSAQMDGVDLYRFVKELLANFDERAQGLTVKLAEVAARLFVDDGLVVSFTGSDADFARFQEQGAGALHVDGGGRLLLDVPSPVTRNEAFIVPGDVSYAAQGADLRAFCKPYQGEWLVAARVLSYDYLWNEVRVKGGAYGCGFSAPRTGATRFYSYRDPHIDETLQRFAAAPEWLENYAPDRAELEGYIVSTVAGFDKPLKPKALARRQDGAYFNKRTPEQRQQTRSELIDTTLGALKELASTLERVIDRNAICVFGNREAIERSSAGLQEIDLLNE